MLGPVGLSRDLQAASDISASIKTPASLVAGGTPSYLQSSLLIEESSSKNIEFTGFISDEELKVRLTQAKILVQPSFYEGFGLPPLQALNCGTNAIVSDIEVFKEVYADYPVTYFKCGDAGDLSEKLFSVWNENKPLPPFEEKYSFEKTASAILTAISK